jgi:Major tropism determinant N-terminal domain
MSTVRIQVRRGTAADWTSVNPVLAAGELGVESDTNLFKFGNGSTAWTALAYANKNNAEVQELAQDAIDAALSMGAGLTKTYNDGTNTITIAVDSNVIALKSYVDNQLSGLSNTVDNTYIPLTDRGIAGGVASLDSNGLVPNGQIDDAYWASKLHVASVSSGLIVKLAVKAATTGNLSVTRSAGSADASGGNGIGETLTFSVNGALTIDGVSLSAGDRVLVKDQTDAKQNGIYVVTNAGSPSSAAVLTRATDADNSVDGEVKEGLFTFVAEGTNNARDGYVLLASASRAGEIFQLGTDSLDFSQFTGAIPVNIGNGLSKNNDTIEVNTTIIANKSYVQDELGAVQSALTSSINTVSSDLSALTADLGTTDTNLSNLQTTVTGVQSDITTIQAEVTQNSTNIISLQNDLNAAESDIVDLQNQNLNTRLAAAELDIDNIETENTAQGNRLSALEQADIDAVGIFAPKNDATFTGTIVLPATTSIGSVSATEIGYVNGVTSDIQTQLDSKASNTALSNHESDTTNVHGIADTSALALTADVNSALALKAPIASPTFTGTVSGVTKAMVGLGNVDNTSDANKPVSTATQTALNAKANLSGATFTGAISGTSLTLSGNLTVNGTTTTVNTTNFTTADPVIYLGDGNNSNTVDLGFVASYNDGTYAHQGLVKDSSDSKWKLFKGVTDEPTTTVNFGQGSLDALAVGALEATTVTPSSGVVFSDGTQTKQGVPSQTTITSKTADYTLSSLSERDSMIEVNSSSAVTITVPANSSVAYPVGTTIDLLRVGSGAVTIAAGSGVTLNYTPGNKLRAQWSSASLFKRATDTWVLVGDLSA